MRCWVCDMTRSLQSNKTIKTPRCYICGRFISYKEAVVEFTPDTEFTSEKTDYRHRTCK